MEITPQGRFIYIPAYDRDVNYDETEIHPLEMVVKFEGNDTFSLQTRSPETGEMVPIGSNSTGIITIPIATNSILGKVKIGEGLNIDTNGLVTIDTIFLNDLITSIVAGNPVFVPVSAVLAIGETFAGVTLEIGGDVGSTVTFDTQPTSTNILEMYAIGGTSNIKLIFNDSYLGDTFTLTLVDGKIYTGVFTDNANFVSPTVLTLTYTPPVGAITLTTPILSAVPISALINESSTFTISSSIANADSITWVITGDATLVTGSLTGTLGTSIIVKGNSVGTYSVTAKLIGNGTTFIDSSVSSSKSVNVTAAVSTFDTTISNGESAGGVSYTDPYTVGPLSFNAKTFDNSIPADLMFGEINGNLIKLDYAHEYLNSAFEIVSGGITYAGTFVENVNSGTPTVISVKV